MLRLALLADHPAVLAGSLRLIESQVDTNVIAAAPTTAELVADGRTARAICALSWRRRLTVSGVFKAGFRR